VLNLGGSVGIIPATAAAGVEQPAADVGKIGPRGVVGVLQLNQAASPTAVAQAFPFGIRHLCQWLTAPERDVFVAHFAAFLPESPPPAAPLVRSRAIHLVTVSP